MERDDKQIVQNHVGNAGGHRKGKSESRAPCRYKEGLEQRLEKTDRGKGKDRPQIGGTVIHQHRCCTEQTADLTAKQVAEHCAQNTDDQCGKGKGRKVTVGFLQFSCPIFAATTALPPVPNMMPTARRMLTAG